MENKIDQLLESEGLTLDEFLDTYAIASVVPGICTNEDCDYTCDVEPDCCNEWCECCETQSVSSGLILLGII